MTPSGAGGRGLVRIAGALAFVASAIFALGSTHEGAALWASFSGGLLTLADQSTRWAGLAVFAYVFVFLVIGILLLSGEWRRMRTDAAITIPEDASLGPAQTPETELS